MKLQITVSDELVISIHALREESDLSNCRYTPYTKPISIHALREESDKQFQVLTAQIKISIHALREESDGCGHGL